MARINWGGKAYAATPLEQKPNGDWLMTAQEHGPRFTVGTTILVRPADIIDMDDAPAVAPSASATALDVDMAKERETITPAIELLREHQGEAAKARAATEAAI